MEKVKFFVKRNTKDEKIVHSICRTTESPKFVFPPHLRSPKFHSDGVRKVVESNPFKNRTHISYVLKGKELTFYMNPGNGEFWYKGTALTKVPCSGISKQPSDDVPQSGDESTEEIIETCEINNSNKRLRSSKPDNQPSNFAEDDVIYEANTSLVTHAKKSHIDLPQHQAKLVQHKSMYTEKPQTTLRWDAVDAIDRDQSLRPSLSSQIQFQLPFEPSSRQLGYSTIEQGDAEKLVRQRWCDARSRPSLVRQNSTSKYSLFNLLSKKDCCDITRI